jgi:hypothetical protein
MENTKMAAKFEKNLELWQAISRYPKYLDRENLGTL